MELAVICQKALTVVHTVAQFIEQSVGAVTEQAIEEKSLNSLVSYVDRTAEERLVDGLGALLPAATFLTEEATVTQGEGSLRWIIDPLDGTTNFLHQLPVFSISVALERNGELVLGIVHEINQQESFYAWKNGGAFLNGSPIQVSQRRELSHTLLATGFPYYDYDRMQGYLNVLAHFMQHTRGLRRMGSAAVDLAYVACGRFDGFFEYSLNAWDVAGGIVLVQEAGGQLSDFQGGSDYLFGQSIIASNTAIHASMLAPIQKHFL
ncbi:MAG: inositol monophosphatase family protein [Bacteroidota bacterium]